MVFCSALNLRSSPRRRRTRGTLTLTTKTVQNGVKANFEALVHDNAGPAAEKLGFFAVEKFPRNQEQPSFQRALVRNTGASCPARGPSKKSPAETGSVLRHAVTQSLYNSARLLFGSWTKPGPTGNARGAVAAENGFSENGPSRRAFPEKNRWYQ